MAIQIPPATPRDPDAALTQCEFPGCDQIKPLRAMWAYRITCMRTPESVGTPAHECEAGEHYGCCQEHALALAIACAEQHMTAAHDKLVQQREQQASERAAHIEASEAAHIEASEAAQAEEAGHDATAPDDAGE